ncbi:MAG: Ig-like domain-containing protein [Candidatus Saccharibacteria bacterium]|nr:Ig-like domain-containing protein [Candidatus Saccharibacteria bacterium]
MRPFAPRRLLGVFTAIAAFVTMIVGASGGIAIAAAPDFTHPGAISKVTLTRSDNGGNPVVDDEWNVGDRIRLDAVWSVPDNAKGGDTFGMQLPDQFRQFTQAFDLPDSNKNVVGKCAVTGTSAPTLTCTLLPFVDDKVNIGGTLWFLATLAGESQESEASFHVGGDVTITTPLPGGGIKPNPTQPLPYTPPTTPVKGGWQEQDGRLGWNVVWEGASVPGNITITDTLSPNSPDTQGHHNVDGRLQVQYREPGLKTHWKALEGWTGSWNQSGTQYTVTIPQDIINPAYGYRTLYWTKPNEAVYNGDIFANTAIINGTTLTRKVKWVVSGGGTGSAQDLGTVNVTKLGDNLPEGLSYTVEYTDDPSTEPRRLTLVEGETTYTARFKPGTVLTFREVALPEIVGIQWGEPVFSQNPVTVKAGESIAITLTNQAEEAPKPDRPESAVKELQDERKSCENGLEARKGTETVSHRFDETTWSWVPMDPVTEWRDWTKVRDLTPAEKQELGCEKPSKPAPSQPKATALAKTGVDSSLLAGGGIMIAIGVLLIAIRRGQHR